jgi:hypothetical protein
MSGQAIIAVHLHLHHEPFSGYQPSLERHGGKTMRIERIKRVRFFISPLPFSFRLFSDAMMFNLLYYNRMETKFVNFNGHEFPAYLNFGVLDEQSLRLEGGTAMAEYLLDHSGGLVHRVKWDPDSCELETFSEGKRDIRTRYMHCDLAGVLRYEYLANDRFYQGKPFQALVGSIANLENIRVKIEPPAASKWNMNFYPAGKLFTFRVPYGPRITKIKEFMEKNVGSCWLGEMTFHNGMLLSYSDGTGLIEEPQAVTEFAVPLAYLVRAAKIVSESGLLTLNCPQKILLLESYNAAPAGISVNISGESSWALCSSELSPERYNIVKNEFMQVIENHKILTGK